MLNATSVTEKQNSCKKTNANIWNPANILTLLRIVLIPVFIIIYKNGNYIGALAVFLVASLTDWLDGRIARKRNTITKFGIIMDPLADKLLCVTALVCLASSGKANWIPVTFVITKEVLMLIGSACLIKRGIVSQSQEIGKIAQWLTIVAISLSFFHNFFTNWVVPLDTILLWIAVAVALLALIFYAGKIAKAKKAVTVKSQEP
jgi:CDP-diacylglycerol--glycerol-3-phosphate 3-phosphatidyltransferase